MKQDNFSIQNWKSEHYYTLIEENTTPPTSDDDAIKKVIALIKKEVDPTKVKKIGQEFKDAAKHLKDTGKLEEGFKIDKEQLKTWLIDMGIGAAMVGTVASILGGIADPAHVMDAIGTGLAIGAAAPGIVTPSGISRDKKPGLKKEAAALHSLLGKADKGDLTNYHIASVMKAMIDTFRQEDSVENAAAIADHIEQALRLFHSRSGN